jgi:transposase
VTSSVCTWIRPAGALVFASTKKSQIQALDRTAPILPLVPTTPARMTHDYVRHGTTSLFAPSGSVIAEHHRHHRHQEFLRFLKTIDTAVPAALELHLICDNYGTHKTPEVKKWLLRHPPFHLHFTPTSGSWLNLVERGFAELTRRKLRRSAHRSVVDLERNVRTWINEWNNDPKPFIRTRTVDEILDTLASRVGTLASLQQLDKAAWAQPCAQAAQLVPRGERGLRRAAGAAHVEVRHLAAAEGAEEALHGSDH